jgi:hypothetical protein
MKTCLTWICLLMIIPLIIYFGSIFKMFILFIDIYHKIRIYKGTSIYKNGIYYIQVRAGFKKHRYNITINANDSYCLIKRGYDGALLYDKFSYNFFLKLITNKIIKLFVKII